MITHSRITYNGDGVIDNSYLWEYHYIMRTIFLTLLILSTIYVTPVFSYDDFSTPHINEGAIGSGYDDFSTPDINEGAW